MKHKKILGLTLALGILGASYFTAGQAVITKADEADPADRSFIDFVLSDTQYEGEIDYTYQPLYGEDLEVNGRQYDFTVGETEGYALLTEIEGADKTFYEVEELFYNKQSPFAGCEGLPVYISHGLYLEYKDNAFFNIADGSSVSEEFVNEMAYRGFGYSNIGGQFTEQIQTVSYSTKSTDTYSIQYDLPNYHGSIEGMTSCANLAGAVIIGYYDRFNENLIPNYKSYIQLGSILRYKTGTDEVFALVQQLYELMGTDVGHLGTTFSEFQDGMNQYVTGKGYTYTTANMFSYGEFSLSNYKDAVEDGKPVAIFLTGFALVNDITESGTTDTISSGYSPKTHVVVGCGYRTDTYYNASGAVITTRNYLKVASGFDTYGIGYLNINSLGQIDRAVSVQIS